MEFSTFVIGRLGKDPETKKVGDRSVTSYSVATNPTKDKTVWVKVTTWGDQADRDAQYLTKGSLVKCDGTLQSDENGRPRVYQNSAGETVSAGFELTAFRVKYLSKADSTGNGGVSLDVPDIDTILQTAEEIPF